MCIRDSSSTANPAVVVLHLAHVVEGVQHVVQNAAGEEHVVDALLLVVGHGELQDSEAGLENAEEALHVLAHALQRLGEGYVAFEYWVLAGLHERNPLDGGSKGGGRQGSVGQIKNTCVNVTMVLYRGASGSFTTIIHESEW